MTYALILLVVLLTTPFVLSLASKQDKKSKLRLKAIFLIFLIIQLFLGFLGWEGFIFSGRSGLGLSFEFPSSFLMAYFMVVLIQIILVILNKFPALIIVLNFINTVILFTGLIRVSNIVGTQLVSLASISSVFTVLLGNVIGLVWINKDRNLLRKYII